MDLLAIDAFLALASELHFGRTAERLSVSQPRLSRMIQSLEYEIGGALFERTSRNVRLTPLGADFRSALETPHAALRAAIGNAREAARSMDAALRIGCFVTTTGTALTRLMEAFEQRHPRCRILVSEESAVLEPYRALRAGEIDVLVSWLAVDESDLVVGPMIESRSRAVAVAKHHPLANKSSVSVEDIAAYEMVQLAPSYPRALSDAFFPPSTPAGKTIRRTYPVRSVSEAVQLIALGRIVHPTVDDVAVWNQDIVLVPIRDLPPMQLGLIWCRAHENQRIRALAKVAAQMSKSDDVVQLATTSRRGGREHVG